MNKKSQLNGYVALITLIIIGAIVLIAVIVLSFIVVNQANFIISHEKSSQNYYAANACANYAILQVQKNIQYAGNEDLNLNGIQCRIESVTDLGDKGKTIIVSSQAGGQLKRIKVELDQVKPTTIIRSWGEIFD